MDPLQGAICWGFVLLCAALVVCWAISEANRTKALIEAQKKAREELNEAREEYQNSLARLKSDPTDADIREKTLKLGRVYSYLTRNKQGVTVFDELALANDINAACAGAMTIQGATAGASSVQPVEERLAKLSDLKSKGLIDEQEYQAKRQKILDEI